MRQIDANLLIGACCAAAVLSPATAGGQKASTNIEWADAAQSVLSISASDVT